jgi:hypothetical protein
MIKDELQVLRKQASFFIETSADEARSVIEKKVLSFLKLAPGWHFGEGVPPSRERVNKALSLVQHADWWGLETDAFPGIDGEVRVTIYCEEDYLEFTIEKDESIIFYQESGSTVLTPDETVTFEDALKKIRLLGSEIWRNTSESSTQSTSTSKKSDGKVLHLRAPQAAEFPLFLKSA